jgi:very-short-patch-repair endonuclease
MYCNRLSSGLIVGVCTIGCANEPPHFITTEDSELDSTIGNRHHVRIAQMLPYNKKLKRRARELRSRMTDAEVFLWSKLRRRQLYGLTFSRQKTIGNDIVDFYCPTAQLVIEIDGGQYDLEEAALRDAKRDTYLRGMGLMVLGFSNLDVLK